MKDIHNSLFMIHIFIQEFPDESINSSGTDQIQTTVILATAAAAISAEAKSNSNMEEIRLKSLLNDYVTHRFAALEEKVT